MRFSVNWKNSWAAAMASQANGPDGWEEKSLDQLATLVGGGTPRRSDPEYFGTDIDWVTPSDLRPIGHVELLGSVAEGLTRGGLASCSAREIAPGSVLFSSRATIGKVAVTDRVCATNQGFVNFVPKRGVVDPWFLGYLLRHHTPAITRLAGETTYKEISRSRLRMFKVHVPCLEEQKRIVPRIKACMKQVREIHTLRRGSLAEAAALENAVFSDFVFEFMKNDIQVVPLGGILVRAQYGSSSKANTDGEGIPILRMGNIQNGHLDVSDLKHISLSAKELTKYRLSEGDILFNRTNSLELVGKAATFTGLKGDWVFASYLIRLEVDRSRALPEYVTAVINSRIGRDYVYRTARRAIGMANINAKQIQRLELPLPPLADQEWLVGQMRRAKTASDNIRRDLGMEAIEALPDAILHEAFAGEL